METQTVYAGFWIRLWATLIDVILFFVIALPILLAIYGDQYPGAGLLPLGGWDFLISYVLPGIAVIVFWIYKSATPGKMAVRARIVDANTGAPPSTGQFIGRYFAYFVSTIPLCLGYLWIAFDARKQAWHDKLAGTVVVRERKSARAEAHFPLGTMSVVDKA